MERAKSETLRKDGGGGLTGMNNAKDAGESCWRRKDTEREDKGRVGRMIRSQSLNLPCDRKYFADSLAPGSANIPPAPCGHLAP